jgi:hypothetical protein
MAQHILKLQIRLPWWWRFYLWALMFHEYTIGGVDLEVAGNFVARHARLYTVDANGRRKKLKQRNRVDDRTRRYFERAPLGHHVCPDDLDLDCE